MTSVEGACCRDVEDRLGKEGASQRRAILWGASR